MEQVVVGLVEIDGLFVFLQRENGAWTFPSGKVEDTDFNNRAAVLREIEEETCLSSEVIRYLGVRALEDKELHFYQCLSLDGIDKLRVPEEEQSKFQSIGVYTPQQIIEMTSGNLSEPVKMFLESRLAAMAPRPS